ncbi:MAG TPA: methyltransferase [Acidimicrobiales bacterium]|nr:methyltransferase [Acidimicrobiales bacterium]
MPPIDVPNVLTCTFGPLRIEYDERVLTPRPWTEAQSRWAAELSEAAPAGDIAELCAGAGHIGLLAAVLTGRRLVQIEADPIAAGFAERNAVAAGVSDRVEVRNRPMQSAIDAHERFALIVADPPYLPSAEIVRFPADPVSAIDGGPDGLSLLAVCLDLVATHLLPTGSAVFQVAGPGQAENLGEMCEGSGLITEEVRVVDEERALVGVRFVA